MTAAGYIHDQSCPQDPSHGKALALDAGMYCPHAGHTPIDITKHTKSFWSWSEWEDVKSQTDQTAPKSVPYKPTRKTSARKTNRRRTR